MGNNIGYLTSKNTPESDLAFTPAYAVKPLLKYLELFKERNKIHQLVIWCPFDTEKSQYVKLFKENGHQVICTSLESGQDFLEYEPKEEYDVIISNPPFSQKDKIIRRLALLDKPYAVLMPIPALQGQARFPYMKDIQYLGFDKRINFYKDLEQTQIQTGVSFGTFYMCKNFLPKDLILEELTRE